MSFIYFIENNRDSMRCTVQKIEFYLCGVTKKGAMDHFVYYFFSHSHFEQESKNL